jgi:hypothetical protein
MPYEIELERDTERGLDRYRVTVGDSFDAADAHELSDWVSAAAQNPTAVFTIDVTRASRGSVTTLFARSGWLRARRRLEIVRRGIGARAPLAAGVLAPLL